MIYKHPTTNNTVICRRNSNLAAECKRDGWIDITPPRSQKQINQFKRWQYLGQVASLHANIRTLMYKTHTDYSLIKGLGGFTDVEKSILQQAMQILKAKEKQIRGGG